MNTARTARNAVIELNRALNVDSYGLSALMAVRVHVSPEFSQKTPFKCKRQVSESGVESYSLSALELLQGVFGEYGIKYDIGSNGQIKCFRIDNPFGL